MGSSGTLYVLATPLGNLGDLSERAIRTLRDVPVVAAEDTRHSRRLLSAIDAHPAELLSYHAHSDAGREEQLVHMLMAGRDVALITDAGTPGVSDPGVALVALARSAGVTVVPIPGPSAVTTALQASGLPADRYLFLGFLARKGAERRRQLADVAASPWTVVLYEAPPRLVALLADLEAVAGGERRVVVARELTKLHEEFRAGSLAQVRAHFEETPARGELTVVLEGRGSRIEDTAADPDMIDRVIADALAAGESRREVARRVSTEFGVPRNDAYRRVMDA
ncbi:MAG TPA: 16S rRNA (cytidine(1402)-2'-O)-methyltransferase [Gemmatimonadales bacterium]|nr:16S rRNA (cytidine(1402)-2'-O)-methyltransferase [Gemmatimonadales bacterium]